MLQQCGARVLVCGGVLLASAGGGGVRWAHVGLTSPPMYMAAINARMYMAVPVVERACRPDLSLHGKKQLLAAASGSERLPNGAVPFL